MSTTTQSSKRNSKVGPGKPSPRQRILEVAQDLFYRQGIRSVGVDAIAEAAGTNKMTLYYHFASKDVLIAECMLALAKTFAENWETIAQAHQSDPRGQLHAWLGYLADCFVDENNRGCALVNAAIELADKDHPARSLIEAGKMAEREKLFSLCSEGNYFDPEGLADELVLVFEGARVCLQSMGANGPAIRLRRLVRALVDSHAG
jgi:AcrR family transcriptional regulator